jgi:hypothetical protein
LMVPWSNWAGARWGTRALKQRAEINKNRRDNPIT